MAKDKAALTRNIFEGARGDLLRLTQFILVKNNFQRSKLAQRKNATKLGEFTQAIYQAKKSTLTNEQWVAFMILLNALVEFILINMVDNGRFKWPSFWKWFKIVDFIREWVDALFKIFRGQTVLPDILMPRAGSKTAKASELRKLLGQK